MAGVIAVDWESLKSGTMLRMKDFPSVRLLKLDNSKACYFSYDSEPKTVSIKEHTSEKHGSYYFFQTSQDDWHPLTTRLWEEYD